MDTKDKSSRSSSKVNLNESSVPLLEDEDVTLKGGESKVTIEMDTRSGDDHTKDETEKDKDEAQADGKGSDSKDDKDSKKKEKKEKKKKEKKEKTHKRTSSFAENLTVGLNLLDRDEKNINEHVNIVFEDVLAEPDASHGFEAIWRLTFIVFTGTKLWMYRIISSIFAIPLAFVFAITFSLLEFVNIHVITPSLRVFDFLLHILHRIGSGIVGTFLDPIFQSVGQIFSKININSRRVEAEP